MDTPVYPAATPGEEVYVDWDEDHEQFGVFGTESGHCYASFGSKEECQEYARRYNDALWG
jgi:hypothetical protein